MENGTEKNGFLILGSIPIPINVPDSSSSAIKDHAFIPFMLCSLLHAKHTRPSCHLPFLALFGQSIEVIRE
jgi:hypothetical protein